VIIPTASIIDAVGMISGRGSGVVLGDPMKTRWADRSGIEKRRSQSPR